MQKALRKRKRNKQDGLPGVSTFTCFLIITYRIPGVILTIEKSSGPSDDNEIETLSHIRDRPKLPLVKGGKVL